MGMLSTDNKKNLAGSDQFVTRPDQHQIDLMPLFVTEKKKSFAIIKSCQSQPHTIYTALQPNYHLS